MEEAQLPVLIDRYRDTRWIYTAAPSIGTQIRYCDETFVDSVAGCTPFAVHLVSGRSMLRPHLIERSIQWTLHTSRMLSARNSRSARRTDAPLSHRELAALVG